MRFELTTPTLARLCSTPELRPRPIGYVTTSPPRGVIKRITLAFARWNFGKSAQNADGRQNPLYPLASQHSADLIRTHFTALQVHKSGANRAL